MKYIIITGGATGLGRGFSNAFADLGYNLIITSRNLDNLATAKKEIEKKYSNKVLLFVADLTDVKKRNELIDYTNNYNVVGLVNNAGIGESNSFFDSDYNKELEVINLNIIALHDLFKKFYIKFKEKGEGRIINVSSLASFTPGPYAATYYATKSYVTSLTKSVSYEAKKSNVLVQAVCPGSIKTNFHSTAGTKEKYYKKNPNIVARKAVDSNRTIIVPGFKNKLIYLFSKILPYKFVSYFSAKRQLKQKKD